MGKIFNCLNKEIMAAMKSGEKCTIDNETVVTKASALKNLKAKLLEFKTSVEGSKIVNANGGDIPDVNEISVVKKYMKELDNDVSLYKDISPSRAKAAFVEEGYLNVYLPKPARLHEVRDEIEKYIVEHGEYTQKQMGMVIKYIKSQFENVDGAMVAQEVKSYMK